MTELAEAPTATNRIAGRPLPRNVLIRQRLGRQLDDGLDTVVTLVCGPGGYGKSLLVASWATDRPAVTTAWVRAPSFAGRAADMWLTIVRALAAGWPDLVVDVEPLLARSRSAPHEVPGELARRIRESGHDIVLVIDDFHEVVVPDLHEQLLELVGAVDRGLHLILIARHDPPWPLHRLRLDGLLAEIRTGDLAFRADEATQLFGLLDQDLTAAQAGQLVTRTEGWAAALRLAAMGMARAGDPAEYLQSLSGRSGYIADYLMREVFSAQSVEWQLFLTRVSVVDEVCADLAVALGAGEDSGIRLAGLADRNVLIHQLGDRIGWYRLHPLLLDFLRSRATSPAEQRKLHQLAAHWYIGQAEPLAAVRHAVRGQLWPMAADLVGTYVVSWAVSRHPAELVELLETVPTEVLLTQPGLAVGMAAGRVMLGKRDGIAELVGSARSSLSKVDGRRRRRYEFVLDCVQFGFQRISGDLSAVLATVRRLPYEPAVLADLGVADWATLRTVLVNGRGTAELWIGEPVLARSYLEAAAGEELGTAIVLPILNARSHLAYLEWAQGNLQAAEVTARSATDALAGAGLMATPQAVCAYLALAETAIDRYELTDAQRWLALADDAAAEPHTRLAAGLSRARMLRVSGHQLKAVECVRAAEQEFGELTVPPLLAGYLEDARAIGLAESPSPAAISGLDPQDAGTTRSRVTKAVAAALASAKDPSGGPHMLVALQAAAPENFRLPFVSAGEPIRGLLDQVSIAASAESLFAVDLLNRIITPSARAGSRSSLPLTERERNILRYLSTSLTAKEIAQTLYVSVNTVKTHMRSIYQKLGVAGRREAVRYAQEFSLF